MTSDPIERPLGSFDHPLPPRPEFAEALLDRLIDEMDGEATHEIDPAGTKEDTVTGTTFIPSTAPLPRPWRPSRTAAEPKGDSRFVVYAATAALIVLTLAAGFAATDFGQRGSPGSFLGGLLSSDATPETISAPRGLLSRHRL